MNLYLLTQDKNRGYDTYDSAVVVAESEEEAQKIDVSDVTKDGWDPESWGWTYPEFVKVKLLGEAYQEIEAGVICASYNAG